MLVDETIENIKKELPAIEYDDSSIGVVVTRYLVYDEELMEKDGTLDGTTFEEFMAANNTRTVIDVPEEQVNLLAAASGVDPAQITVV